MTRKFGKWLPAVLTMAGLALLGSPRSAHAVITLRVFSGTTATGTPIATFVGTTGPTGSTLTIAPQVIGGLLVQGSFHTSNAPFDEVTAISALTSGSSSVTNTTGGTVSVTVQVSDTDFGAVGRTDPVLVDTTASGTWSNSTTGNPSGSSLVATWFLDPNNALFGTTRLVDGPDPFAATSTPINSFSYNMVNLGPFPVVDGGPSGFFSMTEQFTITLTAGTQLTSRAQNEVARPLGIIPEPGTMAMAFTALPLVGFGIYRRLRRRDG